MLKLMNLSPGRESDFLPPDRTREHLALVFFNALSSSPLVDDADLFDASS